MSKEPKELKKQNEKEAKNNEKKPIDKPNEYLFSMSMAPRIDESTHWFQMLPAAFFTAVIIIITRMHVYNRPMDQFFWSGRDNQLTDFFSYFKMTAILTCAILAFIFLLYRVFTQSLFIKRNFAYIPMIVYTVFVLLSYAFSDYKLFALWGYNDRFEGTVTLVAYMVMLFYIINSVNTEKNVKWILYPTAAFSALLGLLGLTQAFDHDFFRTVIGKKLITPSWFWDQLDSLNFTFQNKQIYQTVYNINYVSFYLTLLVPLFGMLFIRSVEMGKGEALWKKIVWGALFTLLIFNLIGSVSSGGYLGIIVILILGFIILNKRIVQWRKPVAILFALAVLMCFANFEQLQTEFNAAKGFLGNNVESSVSGNPQALSENDTDQSKAYIDYMDTDANDIRLSINGNEMIITTFPEDPSSVTVKDNTGSNIKLQLVSAEAGYLHGFLDPRFAMCTLRPAIDDDGNNYYILYIDQSEWPFMLTEEGPKFVNQLGALVDLGPVEQIGFKNNPHFGSGRGFIWGTSVPMLKDTVLIGHGADTYCINYPQNNYAGKYNLNWNLNMVVDKPHCMYLGIAINTGILSLIALIALWGIYIVQSIRLYFRRDFDSDFMAFAGAGIFFGVCGFLAAALVNDSSVSVMPLFYGLLGTGIAINMVLRREIQENI